MRSVLVLLCSLVMVSTARAQLPMNAAPGKMVRFGLSGGVTVPVNDIESSWNNGWNAQVFALVHLPMLPFNAKAALNFSRFDQKFETSVPGLEMDGSTNMYSGLGNMQMTILNLGIIRPYITAGLGGYYIDTTIDSADSTSSDTQFKFGINGGAGIGFSLGKLTGFVEGRIDNIYTDEGFSESAKNPSSISVVPVTFGLIF